MNIAKQVFKKAGLAQLSQQEVTNNLCIVREGSTITTFAPLAMAEAAKAPSLAPISRTMSVAVIFVGGTS